MINKRKIYIVTERVLHILILIAHIGLVAIGFYIAYQFNNMLPRFDKALTISENGTARMIKNTNDIAISTNKTIQEQNQQLTKTQTQIREDVHQSITKLNTSIDNFNIMTTNGIKTTEKINTNLDSSNEVLQTIKEQVKSNGEELTKFTVDTREDVNKVILSLYQEVEYIKIITNDPLIGMMLEKTNSILNNVNQSSAHIEVVTKNFADLSDYYIVPILHPKPIHGFFPHLKSILIKTGKVGLGFGNFFYIFSKARG